MQKNCFTICKHWWKVIIQLYIPEIEITFDGVVSLLQKLRCFKSLWYRLNSKFNRILKEVAKRIEPVLLLLYRSSFR